MSNFEPPAFDPHPVLRGGHLQTILSPRPPAVTELAPRQHVVPVSDGDAIVLHEDRPLVEHDTRGSLLLVHGLSGCHAAPYMLRLADRFVQAGWSVFRMDMRGCGAGSDLASNLTHAGRSDDVIAALSAIAELTESGPITAVGISLGAHQLLRAVSLIGQGESVDAPPWISRLTKIAVVSPPIDLQRCSDNMQRLVLRPYNYYFIRGLLARAPKLVREREDFQQRAVGRRPRTLRELDDRFTAPLSGFADAADYYAKSSAHRLTRFNDVPTLVLAAEDDPIVPIGCFTDDRSQWPDRTRLIVARTGGHVGYVDRHKRSWMDHVLEAWFSDL